MSLTVFIMIDGLRPEPLLSNRYSNLFSLRGRSSWTLKAKSLMPTKTLPCHMAIFHSLPASRHSVFTNIWVPMDTLVPGLIDIAREADKRCGFFYNWEKLRNLTQPGSLHFSYFKDTVFTDLDSEKYLVAEALRYQANDNPDFMFVYFGTLDNTGEIYGWMTDEYFDQLDRVDRTLGTLLTGLPESATIFLQADHGGHDKNHGTNIDEDIIIPWMASGPDIRSGYEIQSEVTLLETAPTISRVLGITPHPAWEGHCVDEIFL